MKIWLAIQAFETYLQEEGYVLGYNSIIELAHVMYCADILADSDTISVYDIISIDNENKNCKQVLEGIADGCKESNLPLLGGSTNERSDLFKYPWTTDVHIVVEVKAAKHENLRSAIEPGQGIYGWQSHFRAYKRNPTQASGYLKFFLFDMFKTLLTSC